VHPDHTVREESAVSDPQMPSEGELVVSGTVTAGVEYGCLMLDDYQLVGGPRELFPPGTRVRVTGRPEPRMMTTAQQGTPFVVTGVELLT
jgi:hypothetical protein